MNVVRANEGREYEAPGHFGGVFFAKQDDSAPGNKHLTVNLSHFSREAAATLRSFRLSGL